MIDSEKGREPVRQDRASAAGRRPWLKRPLGAALLIVAAASGVAASEVSLQKLDAARVPWSELGFRAKKLTFSATTKLSLAPASADAIRSALLEPTEGAGIEPEDDRNLILSLESSGLGRNSTVKIWMDADRAAAYQRDQLETGKTERYRAYRLTGGGVSVITHKPKKGEEDRPRSQWSDRSERYDRYPEWTGRNLLVSEPTALFYLVAASPLEKPGDLFQVPMFSRGNLILVQLQVTGTEKHKAEFTERNAAGGARTVKETVEALRISVDARALDPDSSESDLEILGLRGDVVFLLDPRTRAPLEVSGKVPVAGTVKVRLQEIVLKRQ